MKKINLFNEDWEFMLEGESDWQKIDIPHDWLISDTKNLYKTSVGLYKKSFEYEKLLPGEKLFLHFDGVYQDCTLYVNGKEVGEWKHGYTAFYFDIAGFLNAGTNKIEMRVRHDSPNSRWYSGAGIYRDVWLERKNAAHFIPDGIYITPIKDTINWKVEVDAEVETGGKVHEIKHKILEFENDNLYCENPRLWDIDDPFSYTLESRLLVDGVVADIVQTRFGFREIGFSPDDGFSLNGRLVPLKGVCQHHDLGGLGAAVHKDALKRQLLILREMGVNAIRTAHNPPAKIFMELCDEMGFVVMSEFTDMWLRSKTTYDYARFFDEYMARDVAAWIRRDRNCPSIIMWSIGNEIYDTHADPELGYETMLRLIDEVRKNDSKNHAPPTLCSNYMAWGPTQKCADFIKIIGYNYAENLYAEHRKNFPDWIIYGGETASTVQSRGIYHFPYEKGILCDDDFQCSSLGNSTTSWGGRSTEAVIFDHIGNLGQFIWTGTDYIGEPTPYSTKNSYFGQIDTAGFPKDSFYVYQSAWKDGEPMVHLFPYWDFSPNQPIDVRIASNMPKVELFLNGKSLGTREIDHSVKEKITASYIVPYEHGCIKAVAYDECGKIVAESERRSFGDAAKLKLDHTRVGELVFTEISALDAKGNPVDNANNRVKISVSGGTLLALDNGDSTDYDQYQGTDNRRLFSGKLLAIVKCDSEAEPIISAEFDQIDIPIRKIELIRKGDTFEITAKIHPENATHTDLQWRLAGASGIDNPHGELSISNNGKTATLLPKGDGEVYVRCTTKNGTENINLLSLLPMTVSGYGKPFIDPYSFVSAGLYTHSNADLATGLDRGIATAQTDANHICFDNIDFGTFGSDEITLWIFELGNKPINIEIWQGFAEKGELLSTVTYDIKSIWNTYQPATYKLPKKITGTQTISLVFRNGVHLKGFQFKSKTFEPIPFISRDNIYGDDYTITSTAIENIGNNVSITFGGMNFDKPATAIELRYRSKLDKNSIKLTLTTKDGSEHVNMLSLPQSADYCAAILPLETPFSGEGEINFTFLPGSSIDLEMFIFNKSN
ncbi:MAG: DUF4982 domain-containing protein [Defluviitaleaceae bacterium]|nr:DUF4982 domain-containing protein [Defluviitaleaceae bacterium]